MAAPRSARRGKSGLHAGKVQDNVLSRQLEGKCHRNIPPPASDGKVEIVR